MLHASAESKGAFVTGISDAAGVDQPDFGLAENHAAALRHTVITTEKTMGITKKYFQLNAVMATKDSANTHAVPRMSAKDSGGRPPSCHANITASRRNTLTKSPNPT